MIHDGRRFRRILEALNREELIEVCRSAGIRFSREAEAEALVAGKPRAITSQVSRPDLGTVARRPRAEMATWLLELPEVREDPAEFLRSEGIMKEAELLGPSKTPEEVAAAKKRWQENASARRRKRKILAGLPAIYEHL